jgi:hypothetical protein
MLPPTGGFVSKTSSKLPPEFDAQSYLQSYPDVALSGIDPGTHYLLFGRKLGRNPAGEPRANKIVPPIVRSGKRKSPERRANDDVGVAEKAKAAAGAETKIGKRQPPIIDRPDDLDLTKASPRAAPPPPTANEDGLVNIDTLASGLSEGGEPREGTAAISAYCRIFGLEAPTAPPSKPACENGLFRCGETRIDSAWIAGESTLRLRLTGGASEQSGRAELILRAYQAAPTSPAVLQPVGRGVCLPTIGPIFHDCPLIHPLMPVFVELSDAAGGVRALALLPFPSLLPGGMHCAELKAFQPRFDPMDAFWALSARLLDELIGPGEFASRSITNIMIDSDSSLGSELDEWLRAVFGLEPNANAAKPGNSLCLPANCIPTIAALVSRQLAKAESGPGPFLIQDETSRPRWSIALPAGWRSEGSFPRISGGQRDDGQPETAPAVHIAICNRSADSPNRLEPADQLIQLAGVGPLTILLDSTDADSTRTLLTTLDTVLSDAASVLNVHLPYHSTAIREVLEETGRDWIGVGDADLRQIAAKAEADTVLTISDRMRFSSPDVLHGLSGLLADDPQAASASCHLLVQAAVKKRSVLQTATGGLFPAGVSFESSPRLAFSEPDVHMALEGIDYPVVANTHFLAMWRTSALRDLPRLGGGRSRRAAEIEVGLALVEAGFRNICSGRHKAQITGPYQLRDQLDPIDSAYIRPRDWEALLGRVTVVRELF